MIHIGNMNQTVFSSLRKRFLAEFVFMWILWLVVLALLPFTSVYLYVAGFVGFFICLILFYKTTIIMDDEFFTFKLGAKFLPLQTVYKLSKIEKCIPVNEPEVRGRGRIRHFNMRCNRLFNVTAVELHFKGKDTRCSA